MHVPVLVDPAGDPVGVRVAARRLAVAAESISVTARGLSDLNQAAVQVWESNAQRLFSLVAGEFSQVIAGSSGVTTDITNALDRYANILEASQGEVRLCRQRLNELVASTPMGMVPDPVAVNSLVGQANQAYARAGQAARELSAAALGLMGSPSSNGQVPAAGDAHASFVSHAHSGGLASTHPAAAGFDVQAAQIQTQMNGVMGSLSGLVASGIPQSYATAGPHFVIDPEALNPRPAVMIDPAALNPRPAVMIDPAALNPRPTVMIDPRFTNGQLIFAPAGQSLFIQIEHTPIESADGGLLATAYKTGNPDLIALAQYYYETKYEMIDDWLTTL